MMRLLLSLFLTFSISITVFGQIEEKMKNENVVAGTIFKNGGQLQGYIKKMGTTSSDNKIYSAPWEFQWKIKFIPKDVFENNEKIKNKFYESYEPGDCNGYLYDSSYYESVKYSDMSAVGMNMIPKKMFLKRVLDDKISVFLHYATPPAVGVFQPGEYEQLLEDCAKVNLVYRIGKDGKLKLVNNLNIEKELADCPFVIEKHTNGEYKVLGKEGESTGFGKFVNNSLFREDVRVMVIYDYNENCK